MTQYHDFSDYMKTGPLLKSSYLLASESISILLNTTKPSVRGLFAFGKMGRLHNVLFDLDCEDLYSGPYGIYPYCTVGGKTLYPFRHGHNRRSELAYYVGKNDVASVAFSEDDNAVTLENITMYEHSQVEVSAVMPSLRYCVQGDELRITADFPAEAEECCLHLPWYPLYDNYVIDGKTTDIQYYHYGFHSYRASETYTEDLGSKLLLVDSLGRQASTSVSVADGSLKLRACTVKEMGHAMYLSTDAVTGKKHLDVTVKIIPTPVAVCGQHYYPCGSVGEVTLLAQDGTETVKTFNVPETHGVQTLMIDKKQQFLYCAVPDDRVMMKKTADACLEIFWKEGALAGVPPYAFDPTTLEPHLRDGLHYCSHGMRPMSTLCAEAVHSGDISYVDAAVRAMKNVAALSHHTEDGGIFTPIQMNDQGWDGGDGFVDACRPSDAGIIIRGLNHAAKAYLHFGETEKAKECVVMARDYAKIIEKMQSEDGGFFERFMYPTIEPACTNKGTVNNWCMQLWQLLPLLRRFEMQEDADRLMGLIRRYITYQIEKENSILYVSGGGEDATDFGDALNTDATLFTMQYHMTGDPVWKDYAEQALKKSWLLACAWADMPQYFSLYGNSDLGVFYDQPDGIFSAGGMHDLTAVEANLFVAEMNGSTFAADMADALHNARLGSFIRDNGGMYMVVLQCPNFYHRDERHSEMLMYGGVGVYAWYDAEKSSPVLSNMDLK